MHSSIVQRKVPSFCLDVPLHSLKGILKYNTCKTSTL